MKLRALAAALLLGACAFGSEEALFAADEAAQPFADGARFVWREANSNEEMIVVYRRAGAGYAITREDEPGGEAMGAEFIAIAETPEDDYIAQVQMEPSQRARLYAFVLPAAAGHLIVTAPRALGEAAELAPYCGARTQSECSFADRQAVLDLYRAVIYPRFVAGAERPERYMEQRPAPAAPRRPGKT